MHERNELLLGKLDFLIIEVSWTCNQPLIGYLYSIALNMCLILTNTTPHLFERILVMILFLILYFTSKIS